MRKRLAAQELAAELAERFSIATIDGGQSDSGAIACLLQRYPLTNETAAGWRSFLDGVSNPLNALPIERRAAAELRGLLIPFCNAEKKEAQPDREALAQYIDLKFTLYAQKETQCGRTFADWRTGKPSKQPQSVIKTLDGLDAALAAGFELFSFLPSERDFVCIDVDRGHENGIDGWASYHAFLRARGIEGNPLSESRAIVDTPSGGNHLYFLARSDTRYAGAICEGVEVFGAGRGNLLTAAGSVKKGRVYALHGRLSDTALLPRKVNNFIAKDIFTEQAAQSSNQGKSRHAASARRGYIRYPEYTLAEKVAYYAAKSPKAGRNNTAHFCALRLGWQSSFNELYAAMRAHPELGTLPDGELRTAIQSGISESRKL